MIQYEITPCSPEAHLFEVKIHIASPDPLGQSCYLPAWIRGSYMIRDFARHILTLKAESSAGPVRAIKTDKQTW